VLPKIQCVERWHWAILYYCGVFFQFWVTVYVYVSCEDGILIKTKKLYCVVNDGIFYGYEKPTSRFQNFSFPLKGKYVSRSDTHDQCGVVKTTDQCSDALGQFVGT